MYQFVRVYVCVYVLELKYTKFIFAFDNDDNGKEWKNCFKNKR